LTSNDPLGTLEYLQLLAVHVDLDEMADRRIQRIECNETRFPHLTRVRILAPRPRCVDVGIRCHEGINGLGIVDCIECEVGAECVMVGGIALDSLSCSFFAEISRQWYCQIPNVGPDVDNRVARP